MSKLAPDFVIFSRPRSGSQYLASCLNTHKKIICYDELFHHKFVRYNYVDTEQLLYSSWLSPLLSRLPKSGSRIIYKIINAGNLYFRDYLPALFLACVRLRSAASARMMGYKLLSNNKQNIGLEYLVAHPTIKVIMLNRQNLVKQYISRHNAKEYNRWYSTQNNAEQYTSTIDTQHMLEAIRTANQEYNFWRKKITDAGHSYIEVDYETFFSDMPAQLERIAHFLGVDPKGFAPEEVALQKQTSTDLSHVITNYDEVAQLLKDTEFYAMLTDKRF